MSLQKSSVLFSNWYEHDAKMQKEPESFEKENLVA